MEVFLLSRFKNLFTRTSFISLAFLLIAAFSSVNAFSRNSQEKSKSDNTNSSSLEGRRLSQTSSPKVLMPMPTGQRDIASTKVESSRDPFQETPIVESSNIELLSSAIEFNGIAKSGETLVAVIKTEKGQHFYKVGDKLENGFLVKDISGTEVTVDISNGSKSYRLSFQGFRE